MEREKDKVRKLEEEIEETRFKANEARVQMEDEVLKRQEVQEMLDEMRRQNDDGLRRSQTAVEQEKTKVQLTEESLKKVIK